MMDRQGKQVVLSEVKKSAAWHINLRDRLEREEILGHVLVSPATLFLLLLLGYPFVLAIYLSLTDKRFGVPPTYVGLDNFLELGRTALFWTTVGNSLVYTVLSLLLKCAGGLAVALLLDRHFIGKRVTRAVMLLPWIVPTAFSTLAWWWMFDPAFGIVNVMLKRWGIIDVNIPFLVDPTMAMFSLILINAWRGIPFFAIVCLAALQTVPSELIEASRIDGANAWQTLWRIKVPLILPVMMIVILISTVGTISDFELPFLLTRGGPGRATHVFGIMTYNLSIESGLYGLGSAVAVSMFPILAVLMILSLVHLRRQS